jgi:hypothetical protein
MGDGHDADRLSLPYYNICWVFIHWQVEKTWCLWSGQATTKEKTQKAANAVGKRQ